MNLARYGVVSHYPHPNRTEHVCIGIVVFRHDGEVRAHFGDDLRKLRAIDPRANLEKVRSWERELPELVRGMPIEAAHRFLQHFGTWRLSETLGAFRYDSEAQYQARVQNALLSLVAPADRPTTQREPKSRLHVDLKQTFQVKGWLGRDIEAHQIVSRYPIGPEVSAEFALKNGRLHVIETLDLRTANTSQKRTEAQAKALAFHMATRLDEHAARYAVMAGMTSPLANGARDLLAEYADRVYSWESPSDMSSLFSTLSQAIGRPEIPLPPMQ